MVIVFLSTLHPLLMSQIWRILILLTKLFPNCFLVTNRIFESEVLPHNLNPLSVSLQSSGKKRLILDLSFVNKHVWKHKVKFEDL